MSKRKATMAALDAALRALNETDEFEAENTTVKRDLAATEAALTETRARLGTAQAELAKAEREHQKWREAAQREQAKGNKAIDLLQQQLQTLEAQVTETQARHENIIAGIAALGKRLAVS